MGEWIRLLVVGEVADLTGEVTMMGLGLEMEMELGALFGFFLLGEGRRGTRGTHFTVIFSGFSVGRMVYMAATLGCCLNLLEDWSRFWWNMVGCFEGFLFVWSLEVGLWSWMCISVKG